MKRTIMYLGIGTLIAILTLGIVSDLRADNIITYGKSTWEDVDGSIIFGSYGDEYSVSEFDGLGANDWAHESHFKNVLAYEGYTEAYDYNPTYDGYYDSFYKQALPVGKDLTKISIRGLGANPREVQDVYVLTDEYNMLSAQGQNDRIQHNETLISNNANDIDFLHEHRYTTGAENKTGAFGYNDYYSEVGFKNYLRNEGYSKVYDYLGQVPNGEEVTAVDYMGKKANPNSVDVDYVLTSEYEKYSSQGQDVRIENNKGYIMDNSNRITNNETAINENTNNINGNTTEINRVETESKERDEALDKRIDKNDKRDDKQDKKIEKNKKKIEKETKQRKKADQKLDNKINKETKQRKKADEKLDKKIKKETKQRKKADTRLNNKINKEKTQRKKADNKLSNRINKEKDQRKKADAKEKVARIKGDQRLNDKIVTNKGNIKTNKKNIRINKRRINDVDARHEEWNEAQDSTLADHNNRIGRNEARIDDHENRIDTLEETDVNIVGQVDFIRKENYTVGVYGKYDIRHNEVPEVGLKITVGLGKSEAQVKREALEKRIESLEKKLGYIGVEPTVEKTENGWKMSISEKDMPKVLKRF